MAKKFSRSNVADSMLQLTQPLRSSFNMGHTDTLNLRMGRFTPVCYETIMPSDTWQGSALPKQYLEKLGTQMMGRLRLDTHHFFVSRQRINRDFRLDYADLAHSNVTTVPMFSMQRFLENLTRFLGFQFSTPFINVVGGAQFTSTTEFFQHVCNSLQNMIVREDEEYGFNRDFLLLYQDWLLRFISNGSVPTDPISALFTVFEPFVGRGSIFDYFGYPIYSTTSSVVYHDLVNYMADHAEMWVRVGNLTPSEIFRIKGVTVGEISFDFNEDEMLCEEPLRAAYACWFDHMRDWMLEPNNGSILNPDSFGRSSILDISSAGPHELGLALQLVIPRWRYFADDMISTVQPDDVYRHVYSPVGANLTSTVDGNIKVSGVTGFDDPLGKVVEVMLGTSYPSPSFVDVPFLSDFLHQQLSDSSLDVFRQDLMTMRRAGWLENWLMRNAKHPDTFSGQIRARFGVDPVNASVLEAIYLGGDETMMSTDSNIANVTTNDTPAGQRTLTGGGSMSDSFSYQTTEWGYFITFCSLVPLPMYDVANTHLRDLSYMDLPAPEFATDARVVITGGDMIRNMRRDVNYGYVPRYYHWRLRPDAVHDRFLADYRGYVFLRDSRSLSNGMSTYSTLLQMPSLTLNPYSARIHNMNDCFIGIHELEPVTFGTIEIVNNMNRALPAAIEIA